MTRGGKRKDRDAPERRCIATGQSGPTVSLIRYVMGPERDGLPDIVPDLAANLPGRGAWLTADRALTEQAVRQNVFARAFRQKVRTDPDLPDQVEALLARRLIDLTSLARKAGQAVTGAEKVRARLSSGEAAVLIQARDGAADGRAKLSRLAKAAGEGQIGEISCLDANELGLAFGRDFAIHAALDSGGFAGRVCAEAMRLSGFRTEADVGAPDGDTSDDPKARTPGHDVS